MKKVVSLIAVAFLVSLLVCPCFGEQFSSAEETDEITESQAKEHKSEEHFCITMDGGSMQNTLDDGEELYVDMSEYGSVWQCSPMDSNNTAESAPRFSYGIPARLDIVVCRYPARGTVNFVKRIVGLPGETVALSMDGYLLIDGKMVMEETLIENITEEYRRGSGPFLDCYVPKKGDTAVLLQNSKTRDGLDIFINGQEIPLKDIAGYLRSLDVPVQELQFKADIDENAPEEVIKEFQEQYLKAFDTEQERIVHINIDAKGNVTVEGKDVAKKDILSYFLSLDTPAQDIIVQMHYDDDTPGEVIDDVKNVLRQAGVLKVQVAAMFQAVDMSNPPLFILRDGWGKEKEITYEEGPSIDRSRIRDTEWLDAAEAKEKYGEKGANGVVIYTMKRPQELDEIVVISYAEEDDGPIPFMLANPDTLPQFQGEGMDAFSRWLNVRIRRPKGCTHEGDMKVSFVVGTDGTVSDVKVTQSVCESLDTMVISLIEKSPKWEPATADGHPVAQCLNIPISFKMR